MTQATAFHPLHRADGSATYTSSLTAILAAVNGPVEVSRRDEIPDAAAIEVNVRPSSGVGGPRERWLESVVAATLRRVVLVHLHPRTLVQVTLQVTKDISGEGGVRMRRGLKDLAIIPGLVNAAFAALVDSGIPLEQTLVAGLAVVGADGEVRAEPTEKQVAACKSVHAMAFVVEGEEQRVLLCESSGKFDPEELARVEEVLKDRAAVAVKTNGDDDGMEGDEVGGEQGAWLQKGMVESARKGEAWREMGWGERP